MNNLKNVIDRLFKEKRLTVRDPAPLSWGNFDECTALFREIFLRIDKTIETYVHLPEYDSVIQWMIDTEGKGLLLIGDCGRGKSIITTGIVPVLLAMKNKHCFPVHADDFAKPYPLARSTMGMNPEATNLEYLTNCRFPIIDELGVETHVNDWGEKYEGFNQIMNAAERYHRPVFVSTNLSHDEILDRYGERTFDRLQHLCQIIHFKGDSLR